MLRGVACASLLGFLSTCAAPTPRLNIVTAQGVQVASIGNLMTPAVERVIDAILDEGLCDAKQVTTARVVLVATVALAEEKEGVWILGVHWPDGTIIVSALAELLGHAWEKVLIHEFAHHCHGDGNHEDAALWARVDAIAETLVGE